MRHLHSQIYAGALALAAVAGSAGAHEGDIGVAIADSRLVTGIVTGDGPDQVVVPGTEVFAGELLLGPGVGDEPGFFAAAGTLPGGALLGFNIRAALRRWDSLLGTGNLPCDQTLTIEDPSGTRTATTPAADAVVAGWSFVFPDVGAFDDHPVYYVNGRTGDGIYILQLELTTNAPGVDTSNGFWIVLNDGASEAEHDAAIEWTQEYLAPAPGAACSLLAAAPFALRRRR